MRFSTEDILQPFHTTWLPANIQAAMLRLDRVHPEVSGNKWFKLKYNLEAAAGRPVVTFGGAYSNHIVATAVACEMAGTPCTGIIRGERPPVLSHTLQRAAASGMQLVFVSREAYRRKDASAFPGAYVIPEGGHNVQGAKGCSEILSLADTAGFSHIICAVGTGTTLAGLAHASASGVIGIAVLKGALSLDGDVEELLQQLNGGLPAAPGNDMLHDSIPVNGPTAPMPPGAPAAPGNDMLHDSIPVNGPTVPSAMPPDSFPSNSPTASHRHWRILHDFHEGGYAKHSPRLIAFMNDFYRQTGIPTDQVYTGKMAFAVQQLLARSYFPAGSRLLLIHTGGLQGNDSLPPGVLCF